LRRTGVSVGIAAAAEQFLRELDLAAFSPDGQLAGRAAARALELYRAVDTEALHRAELAAWRSAFAVLLACVLCGASSGVLGAQLAAQPPFVHGVSAYYGGRYAVARDAFARAALAAPRSAAAWENFGTAAWATGDTARAVAGWQRALRLDPTSDDVRARLDLVRDTPATSVAYVLPVSLTTIAWTAALLWIAAWLITAWNYLRGDARSSRLTVSLGAAGILLALGALALHDRQDIRHLAVVRADAALSAVPAYGGELVGSAGMGEVARITGRQGAWMRVLMDGGRAGWLDATEVIPLESAASPSD
jgi:tetratricopeptide (TPR) repeat protein